MLLKWYLFCGLNLCLSLQLLLVSFSRLYRAGIPQIKIIFHHQEMAWTITTGNREVFYNRERIHLSPDVAVLKKQWRSTQIVDHPSRYVMLTRCVHHIRLFGIPAKYLEILRLETTVHGGYRHTYVLSAVHLAVYKVLRLCNK